MMSEVQMQQRLQRVYENAKNSLNIETQVCQAGVHAQATMYHMDISFRSTRNKWSIAKRYSEFYKVRRTLQKYLKQFKAHYGDETPLPLKTLEEAMVAAFPRRHLRPDTPAIIEERKPALETFVQLLVKVIASIPLSDSSTTSALPLPSAAVAPVATPASATTDAPPLLPVPAPTAIAAKECESMAFLYQVLRDFLEYPDKQIESETKLKLAVLSLEDVIVSSQSNVLEGTTTTAHCLSECCSICLGEWDDEECVGMNVVKLPCLHAFHEDCLMEWLHGNTHCPMCREEPTVGGSPTTSPSKDSATGSTLIFILLPFMTRAFPASTPAARHGASRQASRGRREDAIAKHADHHHRNASPAGARVMLLEAAALVGHTAHAPWTPQAARRTGRLAAAQEPPGGCRASLRAFGCHFVLTGLAFLVSMLCNLFGPVVLRNILGVAVIELALSYALNVSQNLEQLVQIMTQIESMMVSPERIQEYIDIPQEPPHRIKSVDPPPYPVWPFAGSIQFSHVSFRYKESDRLVLKDLSFTVKGGEKIGIVGRTGAGKSSLTMALFRINELASGSILIGGVNVGKIGLKALREKLSIIPQNPVLFKGSLRSYLDPFSELSDEELWGSIRQVGLSDRTASEDQKIDCVVEENGENFSVGERQMLCMARALLRHSRIAWT